MLRSASTRWLEPLWLLALAACAEDLGLDDQRFRCYAPQDCIRGTVCDPALGVCVEPKDAGPGDADAPDAGAPDAMSTDVGTLRIRWGDRPGEALQWWWYTDLSSAAVDRKIVEHEARPIDIEVANVEGDWRYDAVLLDNSGTRYVETRWVGQATSFERLRGLRLADIEPVLTGTVVWYAAIGTDNSGAANRAWWWWPSVSDPSFIDERMALHHARVIDIDRYDQTRLAVIMIRSPGSNTSWHEHQSPAELAALVGTNRRLTSVEADPGGELFTVVTATCPCTRGELAFDLDQAELEARTASTTSRIERLVRYRRGERTLFAAILVDNSGAH
ncbi:MAG: hypothetical protein U1E65_35265 [Myxococcota bacterium]